MRKCGVCQHSYTAVTHICPRCKSEKTTVLMNPALLKRLAGGGEEVNVFHERWEMDEMMGLKAFKVGEGWFVNVSSWVDGKQQFTVISVPLEKFEELVNKCRDIDKKKKKK